MKYFLLALQFLTILPIKIKSKVREKDFGRSLAYFPAVGALMGLTLAVLAGFFSFLPNMVLAALILIASIVISGGLHLDGFADTLDAFYGNRSKDEMLEIMRDSRVGVMGVLGIVSLLILKFSVLSALPMYILWRALIIAFAFARCCQVYACYTSKYARSEGKAEHFIKHAGKRQFLISSLFTLALTFLLTGFRGVVLLAIASVPVLLFVSYAKRKIGGMTGDTIGAVSEIAEASALLFTLLLYA